MLVMLINWFTLIIIAAFLVYITIRKRDRETEEPINGLEVDSQPRPPHLLETLSLKQLCTPAATMGRGHYLIWGVILSAIKYNLDRAVAAFVFQKSTLVWMLSNHFFSPLQNIGILFGRDQEYFPQQLEPGSDGMFYIVMAALSLPFIWAGIVLTIQRLRDLKLSPGFAVLFFVPFINWLMFILLCILPSSHSNPDQNQSGENVSQKFLDRLIPEGPWGSAALGVFITLLVGVIGMLGSTEMGVYGAGLFMGLPFCMGLVSVMIYGYHRPRRLNHCLAVSALAIGLCGLVIAILAIEGIICLLMASPIGLALGLMGGVVGYAIQIRQDRPNNDTFMMLFALLVAWPLLTGAEAKLFSTPPTYAVESVMEIDAPPEVVWNHVVTFSQLPEPTEWLFHTGIAYPIRAEIQGRGVGAVRHCIFSTGEFVEPIEVWDEPHRLAFGVKTMPLPMHEWSYKEIHPPHLDEYLQVTHGEFKLEPLPGNKTQLIGTTWYSNKVWPSLYWKTWSDGIIHAIHLRVLRHIKHLSEDA
jgi:uncharacterized membrane protein YhaH (DUF805 family)